MRTRLLIALIVLILAAGMRPARAQEEPGKIVEQYVKAAGGSKALGRIQTLILEGAFTSGDGSKAASILRSADTPHREGSGDGGRHRRGDSLRRLRSG